MVGWSWAWEDLQIWGDLKLRNKDIQTTHEINASHADDVITKGDFIITSGRRIPLRTGSFSLLHHATSSGRNSVECGRPLKLKPYLLR